MDPLSNPNPLVELAVGTIGLVVVIFFHGAGIRLVNRRFSRALVRITPATPHWRGDLLLGLVVGALATLHLVETLIWAAPIYASGTIPDLRDSYYFVLENYTTLGEGGVDLPERWRLIGPVIAMSGLFTFGWTASVLVSIMNQFAALDRAQAHHDAGRDRKR